MSKYVALRQYYKIEIYNASQINLTKISSIKNQVFYGLFRKLLNLGVEKSNCLENLSRR